MSPAESLCLRRGCQCSCAQCQPWISRWSKEVEAFVLINAFIQDGKSLFHICERLSAELPDVSQMHCAFIEQECIANKTAKNPPPKKRVIPPPPPPRSPLPTPTPPKTSPPLF